jgi:flagellar biosynthesis/type III secretory pathway M-ring protein FliF/YscJ
MEPIRLKSLEDKEMRVDIKTVSMWSAVAAAVLVVIALVLLIVGARKHNRILTTSMEVVIVLACGYLGCVYLLVTLVQ